MPHDRPTDAPESPPRPHELESTDPGAYIGHEPERSTETIPGGVQPADERVSAVASQTGAPVDDGTPPEGHREAESANDDRVREAGDRE
jgi:hypothetical protein